MNISTYMQCGCCFFLQGDIMGTLVETDIDHFIKNHKAKLQEERQHLNEFSVSHSKYIQVTQIKKILFDTILNWNYRYAIL